ncbi:MAG: adenosylcobinamide-GDP ribazoletransferase [Rhodospirillales bacterium]|nr:adenosylcobinamide-GDP ribazoletransferase [Rhodospirillales bacterium]
MRSDHLAPALQEWSADLQAATGFLTRVPLGRFAPGEPADMARATRAYPLVGAGIGLAGAGAFWLATVLGLPGLIAGLIAVAATMLFTGALHEDGLADVADGFGGGRDRAGKLEIMRDSRIGAYGVAALVLSIGLRAAALGELGAAESAGLVLIAAHAVSRALLPAAMTVLPLARSSGLAAATGRPSQAQAITALLLALVIALVITVGLGSGAGLAAFAAAALGAVLVCWLAQAQIGGYSGDVLGAVQQAAETVFLLAVVALT